VAAGKMSPMNLVLLEPGEIRTDGTARVSGRRARHVAAILQARAGDAILAGVAGGRLGEARVLASGADEIVLAPSLDRDPPPPAPVELLLALPRPKILRRVLQGAASMGVKRIALLGSWKVEKSYWASPLLEPAALRAELLVGLEQARDTVVPEVVAHRFFKPFVEDALETAFAGTERLVAHPGSPRLGPSPRAAVPRAVVAVGPEGGWTEYEAGQLQRHGFRPFSLGPRPLRVDVAVPCAVGQVEQWLRACAA